MGRAEDTNTVDSFTFGQFGPGEIVCTTNCFVHAENTNTVDSFTFGQFVPGEITPRSLTCDRKVDDADRIEGDKFFSSVIATERARSGQLDEAVNGNGCVTISQYVADDVMPSSYGGTAVDALSNANENENENENFRITESSL